MLPSPFRDIKRYVREELPSLALLLAPVLKPGTRLLLEGPPGSGKSAWAEALMQHLLPAGTRYQGSPSFGWVHSYPFGKKEYLHHMDLDRLKSNDQWYELGLEHYCSTEASIWVEWSSRWPHIQSGIIRSGLTYELRLTPVDEVTRDLCLFERTSLPID